MPPSRSASYAGAVFVVLLLALLCVPLLELYVIIRVAGGVGTPETIGLLIAVSVVGAWMVRRSGLGVLNQIRVRLNRGELPTGELVDGLLILIAGALMLTPGFITDAVGLLLLFFPTRLAVRSLLLRRFARKINLHGWTAGPGGQGGFGFGFGHAPGGGRRRPGGPDVRDVDDVREVGDGEQTKRDQNGE
ncbi:MAG: FxsA family protein [Acidimicrobiaceae bacterium]|nr:FxsA family protein [Acidimicrobiaceae bacterium]MXZ64292.1 FxsA family protein [Acidimicrobiaceae bacterium]MYA15047.1 FxsA family protein [Acidimicrobiaceae bacterium]MYE64869.1 FxsA family protein [Acidimicrobiaceae bacterium]MYF34848.1 FxsA family protein [Acidimicrobiaceae bacterium]